MGIEGEVQFYWVEPNKDFNSGKKLLESDASVYEMALSAADVGEIDAYVKHLSEEEVEEACNPVNVSSVVIEEIFEDNDNDNEGNARKIGVMLQGQIEFAGSPKVRVIGPDGQFVVDMEARTCACRRWDLTGIPPPCLCCIIENNEQPEKYVDDCYSVQTYKKV